MRKWLRRVLLVVGLGALAALLVDGVQKIRWVGSTDLTVEFEVTDDETGAPIQVAEISIVSEGGLNADGRRLAEAGLQREVISLTTDDSGVARYVCRDSRCSGEQSFLRFTNTSGVSLPWWYVTIKAPGYASTEPFWLNDHPARYPVKRIAPGQRKLVFPVAVRKSP